MKSDRSALSTLRYQRRPRFATSDEAAPPAPSPLQRAVEKFGLPVIPPEFDTPLKRAKYLLRAASEIEHGLLLQYLYAAYSIDTAVSPPTTRAWREQLVSIAVQEMFHLLCVQNLARFLNGGGLYFDRANFPVPAAQTGAYPFPFQFEPLSKASLDKYVTVESPFPIEFVPEANRPAVQQIWDDAWEAAQAVSAPSLGHVGNLYLTIYWLFCPSDANPGEWPGQLPDELIQNDYGHLDPATDFANSAVIAPLQATDVDFGGTEGPEEDDDHRVIWNVASAETARRCLFQIAAQGEGAADQDNSHFLEFLRLHGEFTAFQNPAGQNPVRSFFTTNPSVKALADAAKPWARLLNNRYQTLLLKLTLALGQAPGAGVGPARRADLTNHAIRREMQGATGIRGLTAALARRGAAPSFELPRDGALFGHADGSLPVDLPDVKQGLVQLIDQAAALIAAIQADGSAAAPDAAETIALNALKVDDAGLRAVLAP